MPTATPESKPRPKRMGIVQKLSSCTIRIECENARGEPGVATGFFYRFGLTGDRWVPLLITNRHVIEGMRRVVLQFTRADKNGGPVIGDVVTFDDREFRAQWMQHPNSHVDLCALPMANLMRSAQEQGSEFFVTYLDKSLIEGAGEIGRLTALEEVVMVGYPVGLSDSTNNMPIFRKGIAATHPQLDYEGRKEFLIDVAVFKGSSGSPVFLWGPGITEDRNTILTGGVRTGLLGILHALYEWKPQGEIRVVPVPTHVGPVPVTSIPINLGCVIKAERLLDFESIFEAERHAGRSPADGNSH